MSSGNLKIFMSLRCYFKSMILVDNALQLFSTLFDVKVLEDNIVSGRDLEECIEVDRGRHRVGQIAFSM